MRVNIGQNFIRYQTNLIYTITDKSYAGRNGQKVSYVRLDANLSFKVRNISRTREVLPIVIGLPNPLIDEMKNDCGVTKIEARKENGKLPLDITEAKSKFDRELMNDDNTVVRFTLSSINVDPDEEVDLNYVYYMAKNEEDTEVFQTLYPTNRISITINDTNPRKRAVRAKAIHRCSLRSESSSASSGTYIYSLDEYVLSRQGFMIWWKNVPAVNQNEP